MRKPRHKLPSITATYTGLSVLKSQWVPLQSQANLTKRRRTGKPAAEDRTSTAPAGLTLKTVVQFYIHLTPHLTAQARAGEPVIESISKNSNGREDVVG